MKINVGRLKSNIEKLGQIGLTEGGGVYRFTFTKEDAEARKFLMDLMRQAGLDIRIDQLGNIIGRRPGTDNTLPAVAAGSHFDSVPNGGKLDGCLGTLSAIEAAMTLKENNVNTRHPIEVIAIGSEEGSRFPVLISSQGIIGALTLDQIYSAKDKDGVTFQEAMLKAGLNPNKLVSPVRNKGELAAFLELHIEQGPVLDTEKLTIGVVEAIVGLTWLNVTIEGQPDHAGATPMHLRKDALAAAAEIVLETERIAKATSKITVATVGLLNVFPSAHNIIPGRVQMGIDIRDIVGERMDKVVEQVKAKVIQSCSSRGLKHTITERAKVYPAIMSDRVVDSVRKSVEKLGLKYKVMPSGAGHDTQNLAKITETGMIFVPSKDGRSHTPEEWTDWEHVEAGANVLLHTVLALAEA